MKIEGSCHCGAVRFSLETREPVPYMRCYCSICRKTAGGGGYCINLGGDAKTLHVMGMEHTKEYRAMLVRDGKHVRSGHHRVFCSECGSHLWAYHDDWPDLVHPVAGAIDTELPKAPSSVHIMTGSKPAWVPIEATETDECFSEYPTQSLRAWHAAHGFDDP